MVTRAGFTVQLKHVPAPACMYIIACCLTEHRCKKHGCGSVIVIDGNMKNHRDVCLATHAGFAQYEGLPGMVRTGCPNTPDYMSRFCSLHKPINPASSSVNAKAQDVKQGLIIGNRTTRQGKTYEVIAYNNYTNVFYCFGYSMPP